MNEEGSFLSVKKILTLFIFLFFAIIFIPKLSFVYSQETHKIIFTSEYFPQSDGNSIVKINAQITHLRSDLTVKEIYLTFPKNFNISDVWAVDNSGNVYIERKDFDNYFNLKLSFASPPVGKNSQNNISLTFTQRNLFKLKGNVWEVILPVIRDKKESPTSIVFHLPPNVDKKLSLSKPKPNLIKNNRIYWENPKEKTIYATFGKSQFYKVILSYHLKNDNLFPTSFEIAFPPETLYQSIFINKIYPSPQNVYLDDDDNYMARYTLNPKEKKEIVFDGYIETFVEPQQVLFPYFKKKFTKNKNQYLSSQEFWELDENILNLELIKDLKKPYAIYRFVVDHLDYSYSKIEKKPERLGANKTFLDNKNVVCTEFTDLFVALAREKGIPAREINGYAYSEERYFRPLSLISDILHAWPEYFDESKGIWVPIDPTWEKTSGIDYFSSLDFNHLVFVNHGKSSTYPLSAGLYKTEKTKDVSIDIVESIPNPIINYQVNENIKEILNPNTSYNVKISIKNLSNIYLKNRTLLLKAEGIVFEPQDIKFDLFPPFAEKIYHIKLKTLQINKKNIDFFILDEKKILTQKKITIEEKNFFFKVINTIKSLFKIEND